MRKMRSRRRRKEKEKKNNGDEENRKIGRGGGGVEEVGRRRNPTDKMKFRNCRHKKNPQKENKTGTENDKESLQTVV